MNLTNEIIKNGGFKKCKYCGKIQGVPGLARHENCCNENPYVKKQMKELAARNKKDKAMNKKVLNFDGLNKFIGW